jgi:hypothetical protein
MELTEQVIKRFETIQKEKDTVTAIVDFLRQGEDLPDNT